MVEKGTRWCVLEELCEEKEEDGNWRKKEVEEYELRAEREVD